MQSESDIYHCHPSASMSTARTNEKCCLNRAAIEQFDLLLTNKSLRKYGRADLLIASIALANWATLVSRNLKDFQNIPNLKLVNWMD
jgi:hypothetical protein